MINDLLIHSTNKRLYIDIIRFSCIQNKVMMDVRSSQNCMTCILNNI